MMGTRTPTRRSVNGHTLELRAELWVCLQCGEGYGAPADAEAIWCGDRVVLDRKAV